MAPPLSVRHILSNLHKEKGEDEISTCQHAHQITGPLSIATEATRSVTHCVSLEKYAGILQKDKNLTDLT